MKSLTSQVFRAFDDAEEAFTRRPAKTYLSLRKLFLNSALRRKKPLLFNYARTEVNEQRQSPLFSLPGEIRNSIMEYLLVPGKLHLKNPLDQRDSLVNHTHHGWSGDCGLAYLATCRLAHQEGHEYYYGRNMFYLPPGDKKHTLELFHVLDPKHSALISSLGVEIGLFDLTPDMFDAAIRRHLDTRGELQAGSDLTQAVAGIIGRVVETWLHKLYLIKGCQGYTEVEVRFGKTAVLLNGQYLATELMGITEWCGVRNTDDCNPELSRILREAALTLIRDLDFRLYGGVVIARDWVARGCPTHQRGTPGQVGI